MTDLHCRSCLLLEKGFRELSTNPLHGIAAYAVESKPLLCYATVSGLKGSLWEHGIFHIALKFSEHFDDEMPQIFFNTIPFHPNVDAATGRFCIDESYFVNNSVITLSNLLLFVQTILSSPILKDAVNVEAVDLLRNNPHEYVSIVRHCVKESRKMFETLDKKLLTPFEPRPTFTSRSTGGEGKAPKPSMSAQARAKQISFDVYHRLWVDIATTKPSEFAATDEDEENLTLETWREELRSRSANAIRRPRFEVSRFSAPAPPPSAHIATSVQRKKLDRIRTMKELYLRKAENDGGIAPAPSATQLSPSPKNGPIPAQRSADWEREADALVEWTKDLNENLV